MRHRKPIYVTRKDTCLASDKIIPYGDRMEISSESKREALALKLMGDEEADELDGIDDIIDEIIRHPQDE